MTGEENDIFYETVSVVVDVMQSNNIEFGDLYNFFERIKKEYIKRISTEELKTVDELLAKLGYTYRYEFEQWFSSNFYDEVAPIIFPLGINRGPLGRWDFEDEIFHGKFMLVKIRAHNRVVIVEFKEDKGKKIKFIFHQTFNSTLKGAKKDIEHLARK